MKRNSYIGFITITLIMVVMLMWSNHSSKSNSQSKANYSKKMESSKSGNSMGAESVSTSALTATDSLLPLFPSMQGEEQLVYLDNGLVRIGINTKGAVPAMATLANYKNQQGGQVTLFDQKDISLNIKIDGKSQNILFADLYFTPTEQSATSLTLRLNSSGMGYMDVCYQLEPESYMLTQTIKAEGMENFFSSDLSSLSVDWIQNLRQQEKGFNFEQRYTTLTYKPAEKSKSKVLMVTKNTRSNTVEEPLNWVGYKNQFFSTILISGQRFEGGAKLTSAAYAEGTGYLKKNVAKLHAPFDPSGSLPTVFQYYMGPNDYAVLKAHNKLSCTDGNIKLHKVIDLGWPVVREVNRYLIIPLFNLLSKINMNMGLVLLLLTIIVKIIVYPFTYKSYVSSAKMRVLKPYVDEINLKYPKQEDAMRKQQEVMGLYNKYGVSPMGGCLPSLIQMPIWMALFFFVPNAIELRQQSFLWATDLTGFDDLISWSRNIPGIGTHLSIFCVLFCASNIVNTVFSMKQQQSAAMGQEDSMKMMKWFMYLMPVIFFFTFNNYSSGLNYYYFISALSSILIMIYLRKSTDEKALLAKLEARYEASKNNPKASRKNSGGGMMARLEAMQKEQERLRQQQNRN